MTAGTRESRPPRAGACVEGLLRGEPGTLTRDLLERADVVPFDAPATAPRS